METFYHKLDEYLSRGDTVAVATITEVEGSVPREVGAKMIIHPLGQHYGTIGGGCGEADVIRAALGRDPNRRAGDRARGPDRGPQHAEPGRVRRGV